MNLYLDIDGVLITKQGSQEANHLFEFLRFAVDKYDCYWLTSHCKGNASTALEYIEDKVSAKSFELLKKLKPTTFELWKTEGINFSEYFFWLDDYIFDGEKEMLEKNGALQSFIQIDLRSSPDQLLQIMNNLQLR